MRAPQIVIFTDVSSPGFGRYAGTYRIATELRNHGYSVQVIEYFTHWSTKELKDIVKYFVTKDTLLVGISTTFLLNEMLRTRTDIQKIKDKYGNYNDEGARLSQYLGRPDWPEIYDTIKERNSKTQVMIGGHKAGKFEPGPYIDRVILGEGEESVLNLCKQLYSEAPSNSKHIKIQYKRFTTSSIRYEPNDLIFQGEHLPIEIARGCIFKCSFCSYALNGKKLWEFNRTPELVVEDLRHAYDNYGSEGFMFCDDTYNDSVEKVRTYHKAFKKLPFDQTFSGYARADLIISHPETMDMLYESGLRSVFFGIESLNHPTGKRIGKGMHPEKMKEGLYRMKEKWPDVIMSCGLIVGLPEDTEETLRKNNEWFLQDDCPVQYPSYYPLYVAPSTPGGGLYGKASDKNSKIGDNPFSFGYEVDQHGNWKSQWMDRNKAVQLTEELKQTVGDLPGHENQPESAAWVFFNRMQNIGYTPNDLVQGNVTQDDVVIRENKLKSEYKNKLGTL